MSSSPAAVPQRSHYPPPQRTFRALCCALVALFGMGLEAAVASGPEREGEDASMSSNAPRYSHGQIGYSSTPGADGLHRVSARFTGFNGDALSIDFALRSSESQASAREFGVSSDELDTLMRACVASQDCDQDTYNKQVMQYYREHALRVREVKGAAPRLFVDVPQVVRRNRARVAPVAMAIRQLAAERGADRDWMVETAVALVQTGIGYRQPALREDGRKILGFYPPLRALEKGYGDCDTKSALLAAVLQNLTDTQLIGVHVPQHYLIGIAQTPRSNQAYITYQGRRYVLVEAAGPGKRQPGHIAPTTQAALDRKDGIRIDPFF